MNEIKPNFECKNIPNLYFIWETLDIIWETWWFNLQRAWSSGFVCGQNF
jgi:predicted flavoprotein YhiN